MQVAITLVLAILAEILNITVAGSMKVLGSSPDFLLAVVLAVSINYGSFTGAMAGLLGGIIHDSFLGPYLGLHAALYLLAGFLMGWLSRRNMTTLERLIASSAWASGVYLLKQLVGLMMTYFAGATISLPMVFFTRILPGTIYTTIVAVIISMLLGLWLSHPSMQPKWRKDIFRQTL